MLCDGPCMRAFHCGVTMSNNDDEPLGKISCNPLGMPTDLYLRLKDTKDILHCPNCLTGVHQCFACKQEGVVSTHSEIAGNSQFAAKHVYR